MNMKETTQTIRHALTLPHPPVVVSCNEVFWDAECRCKPRLRGHQNQQSPSTLRKLTSDIGKLDPKPLDFGTDHAYMI
jgi:hypothetical protein